MSTHAYNQAPPSPGQIPSAIGPEATPANAVSNFEAGTSPLSSATLSNTGRNEALFAALQDSLEYFRNMYNERIAVTPADAAGAAVFFDPAHAPTGVPLTHRPSSFWKAIEPGSAFQWPANSSDVAA